MTRQTLVLLLLLLIALIGWLGARPVSEWWTRQAEPPLPPPEQGLGLALPAVAGEHDWPQWRGPVRDGVSRESGLLRAWPGEGPRLLWTSTEVCRGYSGPAVVAGKVFLLGSKDGFDRLLALDAQDGQFLGEVVLGPTSKVNDQYSYGPRATPAFDAGKLYTMSGDGDLACVDPAAGQIVWRHNLYRDLQGGMEMWGCGENPLVDGDRVICQPGGPVGTLAALDKHSGRLLWRSALKENAAYSSLMPASFGGVRQYVLMNFFSVTGTAADDGRLLWRFPRHSPNSPVPTPIIRDNLVSVTAGSGAGCHLIRIDATDIGFDIEQLYDNKVMTNHHGGVVLVGGHLYGYSDFKGWVCQDFLTGEMVWSERQKLGKGSVVAAGDRLYLYAEKDGACCLIEASPAGWQEHGRFTIPRQSAYPRKDGKIWTHPVIAGGRLYLRDQELLFCYDIRAAGNEPQLPDRRPDP